MDEIKDYLGEGVYVYFDGFGIELRANDYDNPTDKIYLEPIVLEALNDFCDFCDKLKIKKSEDKDD